MATKGTFNTLSRKEWDGNEVNAHFYGVDGELGTDYEGTLIGFDTDGHSYFKDSSGTIHKANVCQVYTVEPYYDEGKYYSAKLKNSFFRGIFLFNDDKFFSVQWIGTNGSIPGQKFYEPEDLDDIEEYTPIYPTYYELFKWLTGNYGLLKTGNEDAVISNNFSCAESELNQTIPSDTNLRIKRYSLFDMNEPWVVPTKEYMNGN